MSKHYAVMRIGKIKDSHTFTEAYQHNFREYDVKNADYERRHLNEEPVPLNGKTYEEAYRDRITRLKQIGTVRTVRKDAVRALEVVCRHSREAEFDHDEWVDENVKWIQEHFNPPGRIYRYTDPYTGEMREAETDNVVSVVVHNDEGSPHIHAVVIPIDDKGHLNSNYYVRGRGKLAALQDSYSLSMQRFGLERGERYSIATTVQMKTYYNKLKEPVMAELPGTDGMESAEQYRERANEVYRTALVHHRDEIVKKDQEIIRAKSEAVQAVIAARRPEREAERTLRKLKKLFRKDNLSDGDLEEIREAVCRDRDLRRGLAGAEDRVEAAAVEKLVLKYAEEGRNARRDRRRGKKKPSPHREEK